MHTHSHFQRLTPAHLPLKAVVAADARARCGSVLRTIVTGALCVGAFVAASSPLPAHAISPLTDEFSAPHPSAPFTMGTSRPDIVEVSASTQGDLHRLPLAVQDDHTAASTPQTPQLVRPTSPMGAVTPPEPGAPLLAKFDNLLQSARFDLAAEQRREDIASIARRPTFSTLEAFYEAENFSLAKARDGVPVPRLFLARMPREARTERDIARKKRLFIAAMLPHVVAANAEINADRKRLKFIVASFPDSEGPSDYELAWLDQKFADYKVRDRSVDRLLARMDYIPPALAIAQAAKESGWGGSRFAQLGNALYGQWTWNSGHKGIVPKERPAGKTYRVRAFDSVLDATRAYMLNLNSNRAYRGLRQRRLSRRQAGKTPAGKALTGKLEGYSAIGKRYVRALNSLISKNKLAALDAATLAPTISPPASSHASAGPSQFASAN